MIAEAARDRSARTRRRGTARYRSSGCSTWPCAVARERPSDRPRQDLLVGRHPPEPGARDERHHRRPTPSLPTARARRAVVRTAARAARPPASAARPRPRDAGTARAASASADACAGRRPCRTAAAESGGRTATSTARPGRARAASRYSGTTARSISSSTARSVGLSSSVIAAPLRDQRADALVALEVQRVDPDQLVPDLQVADVVGRELRRLRARRSALLPLLRAAPAAPRIAGYGSIIRGRCAWKKFSTQNARSSSVSASAGFSPSSRCRSRASSRANASSCTSSDGTRLNVTRTAGNSRSSATMPQ